MLLAENMKYSNAAAIGNHRNNKLRKEYVFR